MSFRPWQPIFLAALCQTGSVAHAAQAAGVTRQGAYLARSTQNRWGQDRLETLAFAQVWREALFHAAETVEVELRQRALHGVEREKHFYYKGQCVGIQKYRVYNDSLLVLLAKLVLPTYRDRETFEYPATMRPPTLLENQFARLDENDLDELEELTNLASDLWGQVLNILDGTATPDEEDDEDDDEPAEAEPEFETDESEVSSLVEPNETTSANGENTFPPISDSQVSSEALPATPPSTLGKGDATERGLGPDSPVLSPSLSETPLPQMRTLHLGEGSGVGAVSAALPVSSDPDLPPPGALVYDPATAYRHWQGLT